MGLAPVVISGLLQGFGLGCTFVPLNIVALSTLPRHILTQGTAIRSLMRNLGGSIGISMLVANLATEHADRAFAPGRASAARQPADPGAVPAGAVRLCSTLERAGAAQRRGDAAGGDGRLYRSISS